MDNKYWSVVYENNPPFVLSLTRDGFVFNSTPLERCKMVRLREHQLIRFITQTITYL